MKTKIAILIAGSILAGACTNATPVSNTPTVSNTNTVVTKTDAPSTVSSHSSSPTNSTPSTTSPSGSSPMAKAVDVTEMTANIEKAEKQFKAKPADASAKAALSKAYFDRAVALTGAAQYRAALGDLRKCLKLDPKNTEAQDMLDQSTAIFKSLGRELPKEGEEPTPMPVTK